MRVGLVCPYSLDVPGGVQNHVSDLAQALLARGHRASVLAPGDGMHERPSHVEVVGKAVPVRYNGSVARLAFGPRVAARTARWLREGDFDVLHVHEPMSPSVSLIALWAAEVPVIATFHTSNARSRALSSLSVVLRPSLEKIAARIAVSEAARLTLVQHIGGEPVVIPNGLFGEPFAAATPRPEWSHPGPTIAFLGRVDEPRKGLDVLLRSLPLVLAEFPGTRLLVAGRGEVVPPDDLSADVRRHIEPLGQVTDIDRARLLSSAAVYAAPQTGGESFGIVLLEAMAAGAPVVASDLPAFRGVLADGQLGRLFAPGDPTACAQALIDVLRDREGRELRARHALAAVRGYDWAVVAGEVIAVYETVLPGAVPAREAVGDR
ncbi:MAG: glycosyltransferase family 4 protein [Propionibacteriales bacterium]|nr:glycosyltransferase family 4 protein [Propionibacteriales bacterium]